MKVKKAVLGKFGEIITFVNVEKNVRRVRCCYAVTKEGNPVNALTYKVTAAKKVLNSRESREAMVASPQELTCGTFLIA